MSNAEKMVSEDLIRAILGNAAQGYFSKDHGDQLRAILTQPAQQHQGDPVALPARKPSEGLRVYWQGESAGWNACLDEIAKLGPLYTHADPAEIERLRDELDGYKQGSRIEAEEADTLRAQLAEAHALLRDAHEELVCRNSPVAKRIAEALSASAEPNWPCNSEAAITDEKGRVFWHGSMRDLEAIQRIVEKNMQQKTPQ